MRASDDQSLIPGGQVRNEARAAGQGVLGRSVRGTVVTQVVYRQPLRHQRIDRRPERRKRADRQSGFLRYRRRVWWEAVVQGSPGVSRRNKQGAAVLPSASDEYQRRIGLEEV